jgi:hypothetical protein
MMLLTVFSHSEEFLVELLGDIRKSSNDNSEQESWTRYLSGGIKVTPGFTMFLVSDMIEIEKRRIVALNLTPADDAARKLFTELIEYLSPPTRRDVEDDRDDSNENFEYDCFQNCPEYGDINYNCGVVRSENFSGFDGMYIITIPAASENIPRFLVGMEWLPRDRLQPLLLLLLSMED